MNNKIILPTSDVRNLGVVFDYCMNFHTCVDALNGHRYFVTFIDDYTHFVIIYLSKGRDEVFAAFVASKQ